MPDCGTVITPAPVTVPLIVVSCFGSNPACASELSVALVHCGSAGKSIRVSWPSAPPLASPSLFSPSEHSKPGFGVEVEELGAEADGATDDLEVQRPRVADRLCVRERVDHGHHREQRPEHQEDVLPPAQALGAKPVPRRGCAFICVPLVMPAR